MILAAGKGTRMESDLPKVLHPLRGRPMIVHCVETARRAGISDLVLVVGYRAEMVMEALAGSDIEFAVQSEQLGTGHAVAQAGRFFEGFDGNVAVLYGDMPLLSATTTRSVIELRDQTDAAAVILTVELEDPGDFGRILRDGAGSVVGIVEVRDAGPEELAIREVNVGAYCFDAAVLLEGLDRLRPDNAQGEYYLTDVIGIVAAAGRPVETMVTSDVDGTLGINDRDQLARAESILLAR